MKWHSRDGKQLVGWWRREVETQVGGKIESQPPPPMLSPVRFVNTAVLTNRTVLEFIAIPKGGTISRFPKHSSGNKKIDTICFFAVCKTRINDKPESAACPVCPLTRAEIYQK